MGDLDPWLEEPSLHGNDSQEPPGTDDDDDDYDDYDYDDDDDDNEEDDDDGDNEHALIEMGGGSVLPLLSQKLITNTNSQKYSST